MTWMWDDKERLYRLIRIVQKWMEYNGNTTNDTITEDIAERAFKKAKSNSYEIIEKLDIQTDEEAGFLQSWVELGLFSGYLAGWRNLKTISNLTKTEDLYITKAMDEEAREYAKKSTDEIFFKLEESPLMMALDKKLIRVLKFCHESALYAGFISGIGDAFTAKTNPFDLNSVMS